MIICKDRAGYKLCVPLFVRYVEMNGAIEILWLRHNKC